MHAQVDRMVLNWIECLRFLSHLPENTATNERGEECEACTDEVVVG